jgi:hypothetical protein
MHRRRYYFSFDSRKFINLTEEDHCLLLVGNEMERMEMKPGQDIYARSIDTNHKLFFLQK